MDQETLEVVLSMGGSATDAKEIIWFAIVHNLHLQEERLGLPAAVEVQPDE